MRVRFPFFPVKGIHLCGGYTLVYYIVIRMYTVYVCANCARVLYRAETRSDHNALIYTYMALNDDGEDDVSLFRVGNKSGRRCASPLFVVVVDVDFPAKGISLAYRGGDGPSPPPSMNGGYQSLI